MTNAKTNFSNAIDTAAAAFGASFVANFLDLSKADTETLYAYLDARIAQQPLAVAVAYSILCSIENANDTPERDWDEVFGTTLSSYFDDLDMLYSSGLAWGLSGLAWKAFSQAIRAYDRTGQADIGLRSDFQRVGAELLHNEALEAYTETRNAWTLADLTEAAQGLFDIQEMQAVEYFQQMQTQGINTMTSLDKFMSHNPTFLASFGGYKLYEHPTRGDTAPIYMTTPNGRLINTGFYDLGDFDLALCIELERG